MNLNKLYIKNIYISQFDFAFYFIFFLLKLKLILVRELMAIITQENDNMTAQVV